jgi:oligo-1,6-glucosidase
VQTVLPGSIDDRIKPSSVARSKSGIRALRMRPMPLPSCSAATTFLHMLQCTPYAYQGEELGMTKVNFDKIADHRDIETLNMYHEFVDERGTDPKVVMQMIYAKSRDNARTPVQWDDSQNAGFTSGIPWIRMNPNYKEINAKQALADPNSIFCYYQKLIRLRKEKPIFVHGSYDSILSEDREIYAFTRTLKDERLLVILNFTRRKPVFRFPDSVSFSRKGLVISVITLPIPMRTSGY